MTSAALGAKYVYRIDPSSSTEASDMTVCTYPRIQAIEIALSVKAYSHVYMPRKKGTYAGRRDVGQKGPWPWGADHRFPRNTAHVMCSQRTCNRVSPKSAACNKSRTSSNGSDPLLASSAPRKISTNLVSTTDGG
eukprot:scaffold17420_cov29-Tisochrysis_lutea.AAC.1